LGNAALTGELGRFTVSITVSQPVSVAYLPLVKL
jgi:hypothetical protein